MKKISWKRLERKTIYDTPFLKVYEDKVKLPNGHIINDYSLTKKPDVVLVIATDKNWNIITEKEYKYAANKELLNVPAGHIDENESPIEAAQRELLEETGYSGNEFELVTILYEFPTKDLHKVFVVRARNVQLTNKTNLDITESLNIRLVTKEELKKQIKNKQWENASMIAAFVLTDLLN